MPNDELTWLAFRYIAGEMTVEEEVRFEAQLAEDQSAREAVDEVVAVNEAVRIASAEPIPCTAASPSSASRASAARVGGSNARRMAGLGTGAAVCLVLVAGIAWLASTRHSQPVVPDRGSAGDFKTTEPSLQDSAALAWADLRHEPDDELFGTEASWPAGDASGGSAEIDPGVENTSEPQPAVPEWLLTAFSARSQP